MATQVFKEASKAETKLNLIRKTCNRHLEEVEKFYEEKTAKVHKMYNRHLAEVENFYEEKTAKYIASLDPQVRSALRGAGVIEWEGVETLPGIEADGAEAPKES